MPKQACLCLTWPISPKAYIHKKKLDQNLGFNQLSESDKGYHVSCVCNPIMYVTYFDGNLEKTNLTK